ncbi:E1-E2 ATPase-domain-containing protein [Russula aff. rugulosa BPL654]|nr:E1-E2 ATPase-domain-containing protein [Russula aff. rugulosa BPL654]
MSADPCDQVTTAISISNIYCGSCVRTIQHTLQALIPSPHFIRISILSQSVIVCHPTALSHFVIREAIQDAGFHIADTTTAGHVRPSESLNPSHSCSCKAKNHLEQCRVCHDKLNSGVETDKMAKPSTAPANVPQQTPFLGQGCDLPHRLTLSVGGMTCASCITAITEALSQLPGVRDVSVSLLGHSATAILDNNGIVGNVLETIQDIGYEADVESLQPLNSGTTTRNMDGSLHVTFSVSGMTCAACPSTIIQLLSELEGVTDISVNLIGNSASMVVKSKKSITGAQEAIESANYKASVAKVKLIQVTPKVMEVVQERRTVALHIEGEFCEFQYPISPVSASFTIRDIVSAIVVSNTPQFRVSVHSPPPPEDRARLVQAKERRNLLYRLGFSVIIAIPTFIIGVVFMSLVSPGNPTRKFLMEPMWTGNASRIQWFLFFWLHPFHKRSLKEIRTLWGRGSRTPLWKRFLRFGSMNMLVRIFWCLCGYFSSIVLLALAGSASPSLGGHANTSTYFDSVVFLTMFLLTGKYIEAYSRSRTRDAITSLAKLKPVEALIVALADDKHPVSCFGSKDEDLEMGKIDIEIENQIFGSGFKVQKVPVDLLEIGDVVRVPSGSTPPRDGIVVSGQSLFDESSVTGESKPIKKIPGDNVFLGTINIGQAIDVRINVAEGETILDQIITVVRDSQTKRAPIERLGDILTSYFVPVVTLLALLTWIIWLSLGLSGALPRSYLDKDIGGWPAWSLEFAIAVFVVACPCGIGLAAPTALLVGTGIAAKFGILVQGGGEAFQEAAQLDAIVFDKTGTLTEGGQPTVTDSEDLCDGSLWKRESVLGLVAELEASSSHPLATAIRSYCERNNAIVHVASSVEETPGRGLKATFKDICCSAIIGNEVWMVDHGGKSVVLLAVRQDDTSGALVTSPFKILVLFAIADPLRPNAKAVISHLQSRKLAIWIISGDNTTTVKAVAKQVGIPESNVIGGVLPQEKADKERLNSRCVVAMVGDGINDAPALAAADVAIAIGSGSDVALSSASFVLVSSDLGSILTLVDLSATVFRRVKLNFLWALVYNIAASRSQQESVSVVCSSLMLRLYKPPHARLRGI